MGPPVLGMGEPDEVNVAGCRGIRLGLWNAFHGQSKLHIFQYALPRQKLGVLENHSAIMPTADDLLVSNENRTRCRTFEPHDDAQRRRFSTTARPSERNDLALVYVEGHPIQRSRNLHAAIDLQAEDLRHILELNVRHSAFARFAFKASGFSKPPGGGCHP